MTDVTPDSPPVTEVTLQALNHRLRTIVEAETKGKPIQVWGLARDIIRTQTRHVLFRLVQGQHGVARVVFADVAGTLDFWIEEGQTLQVQGEVQVYEARAELQIKASQVELLVAASDDSEIERLKARAFKAGWLDPSRKRTVTRPPQRIGLITGKGSRARADVLGSLGDVGITQRPDVELVTLQGPEAPEQIRAALARLNAKPDLDVIVIARGGGSEAELATFNDWALIEAIAGSRVPVVTAIGHRQDRTLADLVADVSVPTPSLVASRLTGVEAQASLEPAEEAGIQRDVVVIALAVFILILLLLVLGRALGWF